MLSKTRRENLSLKFLPESVIKVGQGTLSDFPVTSSRPESEVWQKLTEKPIAINRIKSLIWLALCFSQPTPNSIYFGIDVNERAVQPLLPKHSSIIKLCYILRGFIIFPTKIHNLWKHTNTSGKATHAYVFAFDWK